MEPAFKWAANAGKLMRVMRVNVGASEEKLLEEYRKAAGLVLEEFVPEFTVPVVEVFTAPEVGETKIVPQHIVEEMTKKAKK